MNPSQIRNPVGELLDLVYTPGEDERGPVVIVAHGVTSNHDRPYLVDICSSLAASGLASVRMSFAGNGQSEGRFEDCTISKEIEDLGAVIDALEGRPIGLRSTCCVARLVMLWWDQKFLEAVDNANLRIIDCARYMDDVRV